MGILRRSTALALVTVSLLLLVGGVGSASAASGTMTGFAYAIHLPPGKVFSVTYQSGVDEIASHSLIARSGAVSRAVFAGDDFLVGSAIQAGRFTGELTQSLFVASAPLVGIAHIPAGATVTLTNLDTGAKVTLRQGLFSIPTGVDANGAKRPAGGTRVVRCNGSAGSCQAQVSIAGGARDRKLIVRLPAGDLRLQSISARPRSAVGTYDVSDGHFARGGSEYVAMFNAIGSEPRSSRLTLRFSVPPRVQFSRSFHIYNLSSHPIRLIDITGDGNFEGRPPDGSVLKAKGGYNRIEVQWRFLSTQNDTAHYAILGQDDQQVGTFDVTMTVHGIDGSQDGDCTTTIGRCTTNNDITKVDIFNLLDPLSTAS
jgi:hypothetical protein